MTPTVSIIIPLYNKEDLISETLESVFRQTFRNWECVIVDDGSSDKSLEMVESFVKNHPGNWTILKQPNQGQAIARNHGIENAVGEFLAFLDADDLWPPNKLANQVKALRRDPSAVGVLSAYAIFGDGSLRVARHSSIQKLMTDWLDMSGFGGGLESVGLVRRSALDIIGLFDTHLSTSSGLDFSLRLFGSGKVLVLREVGLFYRISQGQWHSNLEELIRNTSVIRIRYSHMYKGDLSKSHAAYFFWIGARQKGHKYLITEIFKAVIQPKNGRARMLFRLVQRNLISVTLGKLEGRSLRQTLEALEPNN